MSYTFWRNFIIFAIHFADIHRIYIMLTYWEQLVQLSLFSYSNFHDYWTMLSSKNPWLVNHTFLNTHDYYISLFIKHS